MLLAIFDKLKVTAWRFTGQVDRIANSITSDWGGGLSTEGHQFAMKTVDELVKDPERKISILKTALDYYYSVQKLWAVKGIANIGGTKAVELLIPCLKSAVCLEEVCEAARLGLDRLATDSMTRYRVGCAGLSSEVTAVRAWSMQLLVKSGRIREAQERIIERLQDPAPEVRQLARDALSSIATDSTTQYQAGRGCMKTYSDTNIWAIKLLVQSRHRDAIQAIIGNLDHGSDSVRVAARQGLEILATDADARYDTALAAIRAGWDNLPWAVKMLVSTGRKPGLSPILDALKVQAIDRIDLWTLRELASASSDLLALGVSAVELKHLKERYEEKDAARTPSEDSEGGGGGDRKFYDSWDSINFGTPPGSAY